MKLRQNFLAKDLRVAFRAVLGLPCILILHPLLPLRRPSLGGLAANGLVLAARNSASFGRPAALKLATCSGRQSSQYCRSSCSRSTPHIRQAVGAWTLTDG